MQISNIVIPVLLFGMIWNSHLAGAAYKAADHDNRLKRFAIGRSFASMIIAIVIVVMAWK
jgi:hypothetical protein